jgi:hypothetical protein
MRYPIDIKVGDVLKYCTPQGNLKALNGQKVIVKELRASLALVVWGDATESVVRRKDLYQIKKHVYDRSTKKLTVRIE